MESAFKVCVVDDDPAVRDIICAMLDPDYPVEAFESAEACQAALTDTLPDLLLLDINLPGMNGYTFCQQIKSDGRLRKMPVIFVSGHDSPEERIAGYDAGGEDFIVKPFEPEELLRKVGGVSAYASVASSGRAAPAKAAPESASAGGFRVGQNVTHAKFGLGVIVAAEGRGAEARVQINFGASGMKWLALEYAKLTPA